MLKIVSSPQDLNYSLSLPPLEVLTDQTEITVEIRNTKDLTKIIISENYYPFDANTPLVLKYAGFIDILLSNSRPTGDKITIQDKGVAEYEITITAGTEAPLKSTFTVLKGFYYRQPIDLEFITATSWLNIATLPQTVKTHQPVYLTAYPDEKVTVKVDCIFIDDKTMSLNYATLEALTLQTLDVSAYLIQQYSPKPLKRYTVYAVNAQGTVILKRQIFSVEQYDHSVDEFFVFQNRLGGFDSLVMSGEQKETFKNETATAIMQEEYIVEYAGNRLRTIKKNTGYIQSRKHRTLLHAFIFWDKRFHVLVVAKSQIKL